MGEKLQQAEWLGATGTWRCPHCGNSFGNCSQAGAPHLQFCANCKQRYVPPGLSDLLRKYVIDTRDAQWELLELLGGEVGPEEAGYADRIKARELIKQADELIQWDDLVRKGKG